MDSILGYEPLGGELWNKLMSKCSPLSVEALGKSLKSLEVGTPPTPSFKLYGKTDVSVATDFLDSLRKESFPTWMLEYERSRLEKFGPQGGHAPWKDVAADFDLYRTRPAKVTYTSATVRKTMQKDYSYLKCSMLSLKDCFRYLDEEDKIQDRAAGWNTFQLKKTDAKAQQEALLLARTGEWENGCGYVFGRYNKKKRRIFMPMPYSSMLKQAQYFVPFLTGIQNDLRAKMERSSYTFWADKIGFDPCFEIMGRLVKAKRSNKPDTILVYIQRDFEKMDTTTATSQYEEMFIPCLDAAYHQAMPDLHKAMYFTTKAPIITPSGILTGDHGTASGAEVTNGGETCCNDYYDRRIQEILKEICKIYFTLLTTQGNGDDGTSVYEIYLKDFDEFVRCYTAAADKAARECGFRTQAAKWRIDKEFGLYCQNMYWYEDGNMKWAYPATLILNSIVNPEHQYKPKDWDKDYRDIDIIEKLDNGRGLPYYKELVMYVCKGTKYPLLGSTEQETARILSKYDKYRSLQYQSERFNREEYNISKSPTVRLLLDMRK
nr:MAG: RNA-dependent RNA-polymerase [Picobirnavirus sp.]